MTAQQIEGAFVGMASLTAGVLVLARLPGGDAIAARFGRYRKVFGVVAVIAGGGLVAMSFAHL